MQKHPTKPDRLPATSLLNIQSDPLAEQINAEHRACVEAANGALDHAMRAGDLLSEAKAACKHGEWQNWLADNFEGSTAHGTSLHAARRSQEPTGKSAVACAFDDLRSLPTDRQIKRSRLTP